MARSIRRARTRQGLTQGALAERMGVDRSQISDWERPKSQQTPRTDMAIALAKALGVSVDQLLSGEEPSSDAERMRDFERRMTGLEDLVKDLVRQIDEELKPRRKSPTRRGARRGGERPA